jgi:hypothetical protein
MYRRESLFEGFLPERRRIRILFLVNFYFFMNFEEVEATERSALLAFALFFILNI